MKKMMNKMNEISTFLELIIFLMELIKAEFFSCCIKKAFKELISKERLS